MRKLVSFLLRNNQAAVSVLVLAALVSDVTGARIGSMKPPVSPKLDVDAAKRVEKLRRLLRAPRPPMLNDLTKDRFDADPVQVDYGGKHPFERKRNLQLNPDEKEIEYGDRDTYKPIRFRFITEPLESLRGQSDAIDEKIDIIMNEILPAVEGNWSKHLSLFPAVAPIPISPEVCFGIYDNEIPLSLVENGVDNADLVVIVSAMDVLNPPTGPGVQVCGTSTLAVATSCSRDQFDRPVIGFINFCLPDFQARRTDFIIDEETIADTKLVGIHEVGHVLGVDMSLYALFRNATTGEPLTPRNSDGSVANRTVTCVDGVQRTLPFPAANTLQEGRTNSGLIFFDMVTPKVRTVARNHFDCQSLAGARLENQPTNDGVCVGTHWDERVWYTELLGPIFSGAGDGQSDVLSPLTLALMEDSGWYKVSYGEAQLSPYGHGAGCDFVNGDCIVDDQIPDYGKGVFCDTPVKFTFTGQAAPSNPLYCDPSHTIFALCNLFDESNFFSPIDVSSVPLRYFTNQNLASLSPQSDFCPLPIIPAGIVCTDEDETGPAAYAGESYGPNSRCVNAEFVEAGSGNTRVFPACMPVFCDEDNFQVVVGDTVCEAEGQIINIEPSGSFATSATFQCPRLAAICPQLFCPGACSGRGVCNYETTPPQCECFDSSDTSPECKGDEVVASPPSSAPPTATPATANPSSSLPPPTPTPDSDTSAPSSGNPTSTTPPPSPDTSTGKPDFNTSTAPMLSFSSALFVASGVAVIWVLA